MLKSLFNKVAGFPTRVFSCGFCKLFKNTFFTEHLWTTGSAKFGSVCATKLVLALIAYHNIPFSDSIILTERVVNKM